MTDLDKLGSATSSLNSKVRNDLEVRGMAIPLDGVNPTQGNSLSALAYPAEYMKTDPREERLMTLKQVAADWRQTGAQFALPSELVDYYVTKKQHLEFLSWEKWVQDNYDFSDPSQVKMLKQIMPEYFDRRLDYIKKRLALIYTLAKIDLLGPESKEDLMITWQVQQGTIPAIDLTAVFESPTPGNTAVNRLDSFKAGMWNLRPLFGTGDKTVRVPGVAPFGVRRPRTGQNVKRHLPYLPGGTPSPAVPGVGDFAELPALPAVRYDAARMADVNWVVDVPGGRGARP
jgi:hypothetical protein